VPEREFKLPDLGEGLTDGEVVRWLVKEGDAVTLNQPIVEVETAKAVVEIPAPYAGTVVKLHAAEGDTLDVGAPLLSVDTGGQPTAAAPAEPEPEPEQQATLVGPGERQQARRRRLARPGGAPTRPGPTGPPQQRPLATPPVRKYAKDHGVDLAMLTGTGKDGRVTHEDVDRALEPVAAGGTRDRSEERIPVRGTRKQIAAAMVALSLLSGGRGDGAGRSSVPLSARPPEATTATRAGSLQSRTAAAMAWPVANARRGVGWFGG